MTNIRPAGFLLLLLVACTPAVQKSSRIKPIQQSPSKLCSTDITRSILSDPAWAGSKFGFVARDLSNQRVIASHNPDLLLIPASTIKLLTTSAALDGLGAEFTIPTELYGTQDRERIKGNLWIKGYGDPFLTPERVWLMVNQLWFQGVRVIEGDLVIDGSAFICDAPTHGEEQDDSTASYTAPAGAVSVAFNSINIHVRPSREGALIDVEPSSSYPIINNRIRMTTRGNTKIDIRVVPSGDRSTIIAEGNLRYDAEPRSIWRRIDNPNVFAGEVIRNILNARGIDVDGSVKVGQVPQKAPLVLTFQSLDLGTLVASVNKHSNNMMATQLAYVLGGQKYGYPGDWNKGKRAIAEFLENKIGIAPRDYQMNNACGLHDVNHVSAAQLVQVLAYMSTRHDIGHEFAASLAIAGGAGTLKRRDYDNTVHVRGKTGTLGIASALAGYITPTSSNNPVAFALIANNYKTPITDLWAAQDRFIKQINAAVTAQGPCDTNTVNP